MRKNFCDWEKAFIILSYPMFNAKEIAEYLDRSPDVIINLANRLGLKSKRNDRVYIGARYNRLLILDKADKPANRKKQERFWLVKCDCGKQKVMSTSSILKYKTCGCLSIEINSKTVGNITGRLFYRIKKGAEVRNIEFDLDQQYLDDLYIKQNFKCALTGESIYITNKQSGYTASLDRVDSSKGYIKGNVCWVHKDVNFMKSNLSLDRFYKLSKMALDHQNNFRKFMENINV